VTPGADLREFAYPGIEAGAAEVFDLPGQPAARNVVLDLHKVDYFGSTALEFFVRLWRKARGRGGARGRLGSARPDVAPAVFPLGSSNDYAFSLGLGPGWWRGCRRGNTVVAPHPTTTSASGLNRPCATEASGGPQPK
jgi:hypothetical protein